MAKGRPRKTTKEKAITGTLRKGRENPHEPKIVPVKKIPICPKKFTQIEKRIYYDVCELLVKWGLLDTTGVLFIEAFAREMGLYIKLTEETRGKEVIEVGEQVKINPKVRLADMKLQRALAIARDFGLPPAYRSKVMALTIEPEDKKDKFNI